MFLSIRHRQARVLTPSMFMAHEPQIPSRHDRRKVSVGSTSFLILMSASSTGERERVADGIRAWSGQPQGLPRENRRRRKAQAKGLTHGSGFRQVKVVCLHLGLLGRLVGVLHCRASREGGEEKVVSPASWRKAVVCKLRIGCFFHRTPAAPSARSAHKPFSVAIPANARAKERRGASERTHR